MNKTKQFKSKKSFLQAFASSGGVARDKALTPERKSEIARMGGKAKRLNK